MDKLTGKQLFDWWCESFPPETQLPRYHAATWEALADRLNILIESKRPIPKIPAEVLRHFDECCQMMAMLNHPMMFCDTSKLADFEPFKGGPK